MMQKVWYTYDDIHLTIKNIAQRIQASGINYDAMIAIGGGGFIPARMLRCFLDIPIYAVSTSYYLNENSDTTAQEIQKIQWLNPIPTNLMHKNILVVDEVDDSRVTLEYVLKELQKEAFTHLGVAVLHNKLKEKRGKLPDNTAYFSGIDIQDWWINYPWDAQDIHTHNRLAQNRQPEEN